MNISRLVFLSSDDPWTYLNPSSIAGEIATNVEMNGSFWSSLYVTLRIAGLAGAILTLAIGFVRLALAGPEKRNELKESILRKFVIVFLLFSSAYIFGTIIGLLMLL